jgi:fibronectin type 3 domain-containing protein
VIDNAGQDGINVNGGDRNRIEANQITNSGNISANKDGIRIGTSDNVGCNDNVVQNNTATDNQAAKTQRYGLFIASPLCNRTVVGPNTFAGNRVGPISDKGTNTQYAGGDTQAPSVPTGVAASAISHALVRVTWNASSDNVGVTSYRIYRNGSGTALATVSGSTLSFDDATVAPSTAYLYRVDAVDAAGNASARSGPSNSVTTPATPDTQPPTTPTGVAATAISHSLVRVTWNGSTDNVGVTGYRIYRNGSGTPIASVGGSTLTFDDTTVAPSSTYTYRVDAVDAVPNPSPQSIPSNSVTTPAVPPDTQPPTTPTGVAATAVSHALVRLTWNASTDNVGVNGYRIYRNGSGTAMATVSGSALTFDDTTVAPSTTYTYKVAAIDAVPNSSSQSSPAASATTPVAPSAFNFTPVADSYVNESSLSTKLRA